MRMRENIFMGEDYPSYVDESSLISRPSLKKKVDTSAVKYRRDMVHMKTGFWVHLCLISKPLKKILIKYTSAVKYGVLNGGSVER